MPFEVVAFEQGETEHVIQMRSPTRLTATPKGLVVKKAAALAPCAIVSGSPRHDVVAAARTCGIDGLVSLYLGAGDYAEGKPSPCSYLRAAELLGVEPERCVVVEDSTVGVAAGAAAGMKVIALDRRSDVPQDFTPATWRFADLSQISPEDLS